MKNFLYVVFVSLFSWTAAQADDYKPASAFSGWSIISTGVLLHGTKFLGGEVRMTHIFDSDYFLHGVVDMSVTDQGGTWIGGGFYMEAEVPLDTSKLFAGVSFAPGLYFRGNEYDLGYPLEFRSGIEAGVKTANGYRISVIYDHRSNAGLSGGLNPGMETIQLRVGKHFN